MAPPRRRCAGPAAPIGLDDVESVHPRKRSSIVGQHAEPVCQRRRRDDGIVRTNAEPSSPQSCRKSTEHPCGSHVEIEDREELDRRIEERSPSRSYGFVIGAVYPGE